MSKCTAKVFKWEPPCCAYNSECIVLKTPATHVVQCDYGNGTGMRLAPMCETCARKHARHLRKVWKESGR